MLRTLIAIFEERSITRAAARLGENPSTLSHRIDRLQKILGEKLFVRAGRGIVPTSFVEDLIPDARGALGMIDAITERRHFSPALIDNTFQIATTDIERSVILLDCLHEIRAKAPKASLRFLWESYADIQALRRTDLDFIISPIISTNESDIRQRLLFRDRAVCYYDPALREAPDTMEKYLAASHIRVMFSENDVSLTEVALARLGHARRIVVTMSTVSELPKLILGSDLVVTMPSRLQGTVLGELASCPPPFEYDDMRFNIFWHERTHNSPRHRWLREKMFEVAERRPELRSTTSAAMT